MTAFQIARSRPKKFRAAVINSTHLRTDTAVITVAAQMANAIIGAAHITTAAIQNVHIGDGQIDAIKIIDANITTGQNAKTLPSTVPRLTNSLPTKLAPARLNATYSIGVGSFITLDGPSQLITIRDAAELQPCLSGQGRLANYGLQVLGPGPTAMR